MPRRFITVALAALLVAGFSRPADAAEVVLKDGRALTGQLKVEGPGITVTSADGHVETIPYASIQGISLDDEPLETKPHDLGHSKFFDNDVLVWAIVGANVATMVLAAVTIYRASAGH